MRNYHCVSYSKPSGNASEERFTVKADDDFTAINSARSAALEHGHPFVFVSYSDFRVETNSTTNHPGSVVSG